MTIIETISRRETENAEEKSVQSAKSVDFAFLDQQLEKLSSSMSRSSQVHETFLHMREEAILQMSALVEMQINAGEQDEAPTDLSLSRKNDLPKTKRTPNAPWRAPCRPKTPIAPTSMKRAARSFGGQTSWKDTLAAASCPCLAKSTPSSTATAAACACP